MDIYIYYLSQSVCQGQTDRLADVSLSVKYRQTDGQADWLVH